MNMNSGLKVGALLLALTAILIFAGCTQPATTTNPTPHNEGQNMAFGDGHAKWMSRSQLISITSTSLGVYQFTP